MSSWTNAQASDPSTPPEALAQIAYERPDLRAAIAANPAAYPELLTWLRGFNDLQVNAAIAARGTYQAPSSAPNIAPDAPVAAPEAPVAFGAPQVYAGQAPQMPAGQGNPYANQPSGFSGGYPGVAPQGYAEYPLSNAIVPPDRKSRKGLVIGTAVVGGVLLIGGGAYAANQMFFSKVAAAKSPEDAAIKLIEGIADKDALSIYGSLSPAEFDSLKPQIEQLKGLYGDGDTADLAASYTALIDSLDLELTDLEVSVETIDKGIAKVSISKGSLVIGGDTEKIAGALGDAMTSTLESPAFRSLAGSAVAGGLPSADDLAEMKIEAKKELDNVLPHTVTAADLSFEGANGFLMAVEENGSWYVSPYLTIAEYIFVETGKTTRGSLPATPASFATPADAATGLSDAVFDFARTGNFEGLVAALPLAERRLMALYVDPEFEGLGAEMDVLTIVSNTFKVREEKGNRAKVDFDNYVLKVEESGMGVQVGLHPGCVDIEITGQPKGSYCFDEIPLVKEFGLSKAAIIAVKEGDSWFVSPTQSLLDSYVQMTLTVSPLVMDGTLQDVTWLTTQAEDFAVWAKADPLLGPLLGHAEVSDLVDQFANGFGGGLGGAGFAPGMTDEFPTGLEGFGDELTDFGDALDGLDAY